MSTTEDEQSTVLVLEARRRFALDAEFHAKVVTALRLSSLFRKSRDLTTSEHSAAFLAAAVMLLLCESNWEGHLQ